MRQHKTVALLISIALVLVTLVSPKLAHRWKRWHIEHASISMPGPRFVVPDIFGMPVDFSKSDDKVVLLYLWATWCPYCRAEIPALMHLQERYQSHGLEIVGFSVDQDPDLVREFSRSYKLNYQVAMADHPEVEKFFATALGIPEGNVGNGTPVPTSILIGRDGRIRSIYLGRDIRTFDRALVQLLESGSEHPRAAVTMNRARANRWQIREITVQHNLGNIYDKLGVSTRLELALFAMNQSPGILEPK